MSTPRIREMLLKEMPVHSKGHIFLIKMTDIMKNDDSCYVAPVYNSLCGAISGKPADITDVKAISEPMTCDNCFHAAEFFKNASSVHS